MADELAVEQIRIHSDLMSRYRAVFMNDHQYIAQYMLPNESDIATTKTESIASWTQNIYDTTAVQAVQVLAAGQYNWWTPPNQPWAEYTPPGREPNKNDEEEEQQDDAVMYLEKASDRMMRELGRSNFYSVKGMADSSFSAFATDTIIFDESEGGSELFNFIHCKIGTYTIEEDYKGVVDCLRRELKMTYRQIEQKFSKPTDTIPAKIAECAKTKEGRTRQFKILHCIYPRKISERQKGRKDGAAKPWASVYIALEFMECIRESGYDENPILCRRFAKWGTDAVWGYGPAYLAMPDARQVNYVQQYLDALAELHAYPRILIPDNLDGDVDLRAGGPTVFDTSNPHGKPEEWMSVGDYKLGLEMQEKRRQAIRDAFFVDAFKLLNSQPLLDKEMTAYEISQRQAEQLQGVTPAFTRSIPEFINPLMKRGFGILFRAGVLGQPPDELLQPLGDGKAALVQPEVVVTSRFNDALRALKNRGIEELVRFILPLSEANPNAMDNLNIDDTVREYGRNSGAGGILSSLKAMQRLREERAKMLAQQRAAELAEKLGGSVADLGKAPEQIQKAVISQFPGRAA